MGLWVGGGSRGAIKLAEGVGRIAGGYRVCGRGSRIGGGG